MNFNFHLQLQRSLGFVNFCGCPFGTLPLSKVQFLNYACQKSYHCHNIRSITLQFYALFSVIKYQAYKLDVYMYGNQTTLNVIDSHIPAFHLNVWSRAVRPIRNGSEMNISVYTNKRFRQARSVREEHIDLCNMLLWQYNILSTNFLLQF